RSGISCRSFLSPYSTLFRSVAVGAGELIGHEGHRSARCILRIGDHPVVAADGVPADDPIGEALGHERTRVPTPIEPDIGDDAFAAHRLTQVAVPLRPTRGGHIGNVDVADASFRLLGHVLPPWSHPVLVAPRLLAARGGGGDRAVRAAAGAPGELDERGR